MRGPTSARTSVNVQSKNPSPTTPSKCQKPYTRPNKTTVKSWSTSHISTCVNTVSHNSSRRLLGRIYRSLKVYWERGSVRSIRNSRESLHCIVRGRHRELLRGMYRLSREIYRMICMQVLKLLLMKLKNLKLSIMNWLQCFKVEMK